MIRVFDAFSGIGGFRSALERVGGFEIVGWCEIDRFAQKAYKALYDTGGEQFYENIRDIDVGKLADFDLLIGGFPCQPFSVCGARKGFADERGDLFFELARLLEAKRPKYFCFENVPGLMGIDSGKTFAKIASRTKTLLRQGVFGTEKRFFQKILPPFLSTVARKGGVWYNVFR